MYMADASTLGHSTSQQPGAQHIHPPHEDVPSPYVDPGHGEDSSGSDQCMLGLPVRLLHILRVSEDTYPDTEWHMILSETANERRQAPVFQEQRTRVSRIEEIQDAGRQGIRLVTLQHESG